MTPTHRPVCSEDWMRRERDSLHRLSASSQGWPSQQLYANRPKRFCPLMACSSQIACESPPGQAYHYLPTKSASCPPTPTTNQLYRTSSIDPFIKRRADDYKAARQNLQTFYFRKYNRVLSSVSPRVIRSSPTETLRPKKSQNFSSRRVLQSKSRRNKVWRAVNNLHNIVVMSYNLYNIIKTRFNLKR